MESFYITVLVFFLPLILILILLTRTFYQYCSLYRKKKNPDFPILPGEAAEYLLNGPKSFLKIYLAPFFMWKILFERHKDIELNKSAQKVRTIFLIYIGVVFLEFIMLAAYLFS